MTSFTGRMIGAARLDTRVFEEIEADGGATGQALLVVVLSSAAAAIGTARFGLLATFYALVAALVGWFVGAGLIYLVGTKLLPGAKTQADLGELLRVIGFAAAPGLLQIFGLIPCAGALVALAAWIWTLAATLVGVNRALDHDGYGRTVAVCVVGWIAVVAIRTVAMMLGMGAGIFGGMIGR